jgi:dihydroorotase
MRIEIVGADVVDPSNGVNGRFDVFINDGAIAAIGNRPDGFNADQRINGQGLTAVPGFIELSARVREPGQEHKATISSEAYAAVANGITTLCVPPDTDPVIDSPAVVELIEKRAREVNLARIEVIGALTHGLACERLAEMFALREAGCIAMSNADRTIANSEVMRRALEYATTFDLTVMTQCEDPWLAARRVVHGGANSFNLGLDPIPESAETIIVARDLLLAEQTGARVHFCRLSAGRSVDMIRRAKATGLPVTADVAVHQLYLTEDSLEGFDTRCHVRPPLRREADKAALRAGVADGTIDAITSDHQPHDADAKLNPFTETEPGISGLDTLVGLSLNVGHEERIDVTRIVAALSCAPAAIAQLERGQLGVGATADLCLLQLDATTVFDDQQMLSKGKNNPFRGTTLPGRVSHTFVGGKLKYQRENPTP